MNGMVMVMDLSVVRLMFHYLIGTVHKLLSMLKQIMSVVCQVVVTAMIQRVATFQVLYIKQRVI